MEKKIAKIVSIGNRILPFVIMAIEIAQWVKKRDSNCLTEAFLWGAIGCLEIGFIQRGKTDDSIH